MNRFFKSPNPFQVSPAWASVSYIILGIWTIIVLFPFYWLAVTAFKLPIDVNSGPKYIPYVDYQPSLHAFEELLWNPESGNFVTRPYTNTIIVGLTSAVLALILGAMAAYALIRFEYHPKPGLIAVFAGCVLFIILITNLGVPWQLSVVVGFAIYVLLAQGIGKRFKGTMNNNDIFFWLVSQRMLPPVAVIIPIYIIFQQLRLLNTHAALIITYTAINIPMVIWFMRDYFSGIPIELEESAFIDGASRYQVLWTIVLPLAVPGLIATFLIVLVFTWNEYTLGLFLSGADTQTMPPFVSAQNATRGPQWWNISVLVLLMVAPLFLMSILLERFIARGLLIGAVKG
jgi:multiple sugar transport system permease protein